MRWALNSTRPTAGEDLRADLLAEMDHHAATQPDSVARQLHPYTPSTEDMMSPEVYQRRMAEVETARAKVRADVLAQLPQVQKQMTAAIDAACAIASLLGAHDTLMLATLSGHVDPDFSNGIEERVQVSVDVAAPDDR